MAFANGVLLLAVLVCPATVDRIVEEDRRFPAFLPTERDGFDVPLQEARGHVLRPGRGWNCYQTLSRHQRVSRLVACARYKLGILS
jgi:hypothetical protein